MDSNQIPDGFRNNRRGYILIQSVTLVRIPLSVIFFVLLTACKESTLTLVLAVGVLLLVETTDAVDGHIARYFNLASEYGATLDPYADSISRLIVYSALASKNRVFLLVPLIMALRDITVAYARILLAKKNRSVSARISGKIKAIVQAVGSFLAILGPYYWDRVGDWSFYALSWIIITVTFLSSIEYVRDAFLAIKDK
ncbi:MAG: CDP-alcohol phosphatidyltransferase family protein [Candidatus Aminicenantes bacterium]|jgi:CDP-diacylglycerol--glycerol-3-phosphate 3-phosphatidyltransferase